MNADPHWQNIGRRPHHGICVPLFSLRSQMSCGIGEFMDLIPLIDWCHHIGLDVIQLLPLFDSGMDPSPYNVLSSCALDPMYISLKHLPDMQESLSSFIPLTQCQRIDRARVRTMKLECLHRYFVRNGKLDIPLALKKCEKCQGGALQFEPGEAGAEAAKLKKFSDAGGSQIQWLPDADRFTLFDRERYTSFLSEHPWVQPYAAWKARESKYNDPQFYAYLQFLSFQQMQRVHQHAKSRGVLLLTDLPILLSPDSVDIEEYPNLFDLHLDAGSPPDYYNHLGQHWGFPLYRWDAMRAEGFPWWRRRLQAIAPYSDLYRIDHAAGLFRIWGIPKGKPPVEGTYYPINSSLWIPQGKELLEMMLKSSKLLPIAEDLGTLPEGMRACLKELGISGTKVIRWERTRTDRWHYTAYREYDALSLTTVSTPDSEPLALWWQLYPDEAAAFAEFKHWTYEPVLSREQRRQILWDSHHTPSFFHINLLQETLALFPELVWPRLEDERINIPGTVLPTNWTYRFKPSIEEMMEHKGLTEAFQELVK